MTTKTPKTENNPAEHRPQWWEQSTAHGLISLELTESQAREATPAGRDAAPYIAALIQHQDVKDQLNQLPAEVIRDYLQESGAWAAEELQSDLDNQERLLWLACGDITEQAHTRDSEQ